MIYLAILLLAQDAFSTPKEKTAKAATDAWIGCLKSKTNEFSASTEAVDIVATAIMSACSSYESAAHEAWLTLAYPIYKDEAPDKNDRDMAKMRIAFNEKVVEELVRRRIQAK